MNTEEQIELLKMSSEKWNEWREENPTYYPQLRNVDFIKEFGGKSIYDTPSFEGVNFSNTDFNMSIFRDCMFINCCFDNAKITFADLVGAYFDSCTFKNACMRVNKIGNAEFHSCTFDGTDLSYCSAEQTSFEGSSIQNSRLEYISFVSNDFSNTLIENCNVYGISAWELNLTNSTQKDLIITPDDAAIVTVDNIELAQFIYLIIHNNKLREIINTITSKVVLILGNFSIERKKVLNEIRKQLRKYNFVPVMFDFNKPDSRDLTETVQLLASMSKFVIADLSSPRSIPHELSHIIESNPSVTIYPIILENEKSYGMFEDHYKRYTWVKPTQEYTNDNLKQLVERIVKEQQE